MDEISMQCRELWVKQIAHRDVGGPHAVSRRPERNGKLTFPGKREFRSRWPFPLPGLQPVGPHRRSELACLHCHTGQVLRITLSLYKSIALVPSL